jgi:hypothetical protein
VERVVSHFNWSRTTPRVVLWARLFPEAFPMRGADQPQSTMFSYVSIEDRIPADHPLRAMHALVQPILRALREGNDFRRFGFGCWKGDSGCAHRFGLRLVNLRLIQIKRNYQRIFEKIRNSEDFIEAIVLCAIFLTEICQIKLGVKSHLF